MCLFFFFLSLTVFALWLLYTDPVFVRLLIMWARKRWMDADPKKADMKAKPKPGYHAMFGDL